MNQLDLLYVCLVSWLQYPGFDNTLVVTRNTVHPAKCPGWGVEEESFTAWGKFTLHDAAKFQTSSPDTCKLQSGLSVSELDEQGSSAELKAD